MLLQGLGSYLGTTKGYQIRLLLFHGCALVTTYFVLYSMWLEQRTQPCYKGWAIYYQTIPVSFSVGSHDKDLCLRNKTHFCCVVLLAVLDSRTSCTLISHGLWLKIVTTYSIFSDMYLSMLVYSVTHAMLVYSVTCICRC